MPVAIGSQHILAAPVTVWVANTGTPFPEIEDDVDPVWAKVGTEGPANYADEGVDVRHEQTLGYMRSAGHTLPRKAFRSEEGLALGFELVDLSPDQYAHALGVAGIYRGASIQQFAVLARGEIEGDDPVFEWEWPDLSLQYELPFTIQSAEPAPVYAKGIPAVLAVEYTALDIGTPRVRVQPGEDLILV